MAGTTETAPQPQDAQALALRAELRRLRAALAAEGDDAWLSVWRKEPRPAAPLKEIAFLIEVTADRLNKVRGGPPPAP